MNIVHVAVGVVINARGEILVSRRHKHAHQGGLWEFPGGKVEQHEVVEEALKRELFEEANLTAITLTPLIKVQHHYPDKTVLLDVWKVTQFTGDVFGKEGQITEWRRQENLKVKDFPAANKAIITALRLPDYCLITPDLKTYTDEYFLRFEDALKAGVRLVQLRSPLLSNDEYTRLAKQVASLCEKYGARLLANACPSIFKSLSVQGLHLNHRRLFEYSTRPVDESKLLSAACHDKKALEQARLIGVDLVFISPVLKTLTHPDADVLGWEQAAELVAEANMPAYFLGGLCKRDLSKAQALGARGIAGIRMFE